MQKQNFSEQLWSGVGDAIADIREKLEESLWGRAVTERGEAPQWPQAREEQQPEFASREHTRDVAPDIDLDR